MSLDFLHRPPESGTHALKLDSSEGLEIQNNCPVPDQVGESGDMCREMDVDEMARLLPRLIIGACRAYQIRTE